LTQEGVAIYSNTTEGCSVDWNIKIL